MDKETQDIYEQYFELFGTPGWQQFAKDLEDSKDEFNDVLSIKDAKELHQRQGQITVINRIINMPDMMEYAYGQIEAETDA